MPTVPTLPSTRIHSCSGVYFRALMDFLSSLAFVIVFDEGECCGLGRLRFAAYQQSQGRADRRGRGRDITHGDRAAEAGPETAAGDLAEPFAADILNLGMVAGRLAPVGQNSHAPARRPFGQLLLDHAGTGKSALLAPPPTDAPGK